MNAGSGNTWLRKNDVRTRDLSIEAKYTDKMSFSLKLADLEKAEYLALLDNRDSAFVVDFGRRSYTIIPTDDYIMLREDAYGSEA